MYNREKTLAIVTGLSCTLIFLGGTTLGAYHSISTLGAIGLLGLASYCLADIAIIWAAYIDYHEDGGAMEWIAWGVKYILSLYLLFSGALIAYVLIDRATHNQQSEQMNSSYQQAYDDCIKAGGKSSSCRKMAEPLLQANKELIESGNKKKAGDNQWAEAFISYPLFKYIPGILGVFGLLILTLASKLWPQVQDQIRIQEIHRMRANVTQPASQASFRSPTTLKRIQFPHADGVRCWSLYKQPSGYIVRDESSTYRGHVSHRKFDSNPHDTYDHIERLI